MSTNYQEQKIYKADASCVFRKTKELYGGLSNMSSSYPLKVNGVHIPSSEALYQACRFPHLPDVQRKIISQKSPMAAKMVSKPHRPHSRTDWEDTRIQIMQWCLKVKLSQHVREFGKLLNSTDNKPIVEDSRRDDFWGAIRDKQDDNILKGMNVLGILLIELRQFYNDTPAKNLLIVEPPDIPNFTLFQQEIETG